MVGSRPDSRDTFVCLSKRKYPKERTPCRRGASHSLALLLKPGGNQTRPNSLHKTQAVAELKQVIAESPRFDCAAQRGRRGGNSPGCNYPRPRPPPVIPTKAGIQSQTKIIESSAAAAIETPTQIPFLPRRAAQPRRELSAINCPSSAARQATPALLGRVLIAARLGAQRRVPLKGA